ncbi:MAG: hypothetical protein WBA10_17365 [Elainellaceae cyanobacterium]
MAPEPNEPTPQSPNDGGVTPDEISADGDRVSPASGAIPPLPDVEPMIVESTAAMPEPKTSEPEIPESEAPEPKPLAPEAPEPEMSESLSESSDNSKSSPDNSSAAVPESTTVTFEDIAPVAPPAPPPAVEPSPKPTATPEPQPQPQPTPPKSSISSSSKPPTSSAGTVQRIWGLLRPPLTAAAKTTLATGVKGANWLTQQLESAPLAPGSNQTGVLGILTGVWRIVKPLLVAVTLSLSRLFNQLLQWSLERLDPEVKAAAAAESSRTAFLITSATLALLFFLFGSLINPSSATPKTPGNGVVAVRSAPNQARLDAMQERVSDVVDRYDGTVYAVGLDAVDDRLTVTLDDGWYRLSENQQQRFARQLQREASDAKFPQLTLLNERSERLARTPVVGDKMILFQTPAPPPPPEVPDTLDSPGQAPSDAASDDTTRDELSNRLAPSTADSASLAAESPDPSSPTVPAPPE